jgi:hypothetical protein
MRRSSELGFVALAAGAALAAAAPPPAAPALGRLSFVERRVEMGSGRGWAAAAEGRPVRPGDGVRTAPDALARLQLPWMAMTLSPGSVVRFPDEYLLAALLEEGRVQLQSGDREILKLVTPEGVVRGRGWAVVRRQDKATAVSVLAGRFVVEAAGKVVALAAGTGTVVRDGSIPAPPVPLLDPPSGLSPGSDPFYAPHGQSITLSWTPAATRHQVEVLPVGSEEVLLQQDVPAPPLRVSIPWRGAFRWRVSGRDARGLEGRAAADGLFSVEE